MTTLLQKVVLITGAARRVGAAMVRELHAQGTNIILHYRSAVQDANALANELNAVRPNSVKLLKFDLNDIALLPKMVEQAHACWGKLDVLINNASSFFPTPFGEITEAQWDILFNSTLKAAFFLSQWAAPLLKAERGCIINITDIHAQKPLKNYSVYSLAKAGLAMLTQVLAKELAPEVRVNSVAPGSVIWPEGENELSESIKADILSRIPLRRQGQASYIAKAVLFLIKDADYVTGQTIVVDGGRLLNC